MILLTNHLGMKNQGQKMQHSTSVHKQPTFFNLSRMLTAFSFHFPSLTCVLTPSSSWLPVIPVGVASSRAKSTSVGELLEPGNRVSIGKRLRRLQG
jgi:hypothetical protein